MTVVNLVYMVEVAGLDPLQMVLVGTALELSAFVFEIPTGVVADAFSRKLSVVIGHFLTGVSFILLAAFPRFDVIILSQVIWGFGWTFISGAYPAWLSEEIGVVRANAAFVRGTEIYQIGAFFGIGVGIALAHVSLATPIWVGGCGVVALAILSLILMPETGFTPVARASRETWGAMASTFRHGVGALRAQPVLVTIMLVAVVFGLFSEGLDRLYTPFLIESFRFPAIGNLDGVIWWGIIAAVAQLAGLVATAIARRAVDTDSHVQLTAALCALTVGIALAVLGFAHLDGMMAVLVCFWIASALRAAESPLSTAWLNRRIPSGSRATLLSMQGQADSLGQALAGPVVGMVAKFVSMAAALTLSAVVLLPALELYRRAAGAKETATTD